MRVLFVDDHEVVWGGMRDVVESLHAQRPGAERFEWHCALDLAGALALNRQPLDLILLDYHLPGTDCLRAMRALREQHEAAPIVVVSGDENADVICRCIEAGAAGYVPKSLPRSEMLAALGFVVAHGVYLPRAALLRGSSTAPRHDDDAQVGNEAMFSFMSNELSPRQREVFARALRGKPNKVIARELGIAEGTVKVHLAMVFRALGVRNRTEAMYRLLSADAMAAVARL